MPCTNVPIHYPLCPATPSGEPAQSGRLMKVEEEQMQNRCSDTEQRFKNELPGNDDIDVIKENTKSGEALGS